MIFVPLLTSVFGISFFIGRTGADTTLGNQGMIQSRAPEASTAATGDRVADS